MMEREFFPFSLQKKSSKEYFVRFLQRYSVKIDRDFILQEMAVVVVATSICSIQILLDYYSFSLHQY